MFKLREFFKRHILWVGLSVVAVPLLILLGLQYRYLSALEWSLPGARKDLMRSYLSEVASKIEEYYRTSADRVLNVPPSAFAVARTDERSLSEAAAHFEKNQFKAARRLFVGLSGEYESGGSYVLVLFYDPAGEQTFHREAGSRDWSAAHAAIASWMIYNLTNTTPDSTDLTVDERDPNVRVITKPILDEKNSMVVGVAGMIVDQAFFQETLLPGMIEESLPAHFPEDYQETVVNLRDSEGKLLPEGRQARILNDEAAVPLQFVFSDWRVGMGMLHMTEKQWARRLFAFNLSLSLLMTALLIGGIAMALRSASREMKLSQMKADFVSNVSHELRTPLASIRVFGEFLRLGRVKEPEKIREYGEYIETESRRLTQLINNILDFSKIESGHKTYQFEEADVEDVVLETLRAFKVRLDQCGFNIVFESPGRPLPSAVIDADAIAQAFTNLLDNAVKYSGSSSEIAVRLEEKDGYIIISVTDHGIGIPREEREKIFDKFYRVSTGLVHDVKGSGLGLAIVKHIVEAHRGKMIVEGKQNAGSTFTIHLPAGPDAKSGSHEEETQPADEKDASLGLNTVPSDN